MEQIAIALNELSVAFAHLSEALKQDVKAADAVKAEKAKAKATKAATEPKEAAVTENELEKKAAEIEEARKRAVDISEPIKKEIVREILSNLSKNGHTSEVKALLNKYGTGKLSSVDPKDYVALVKDAQAIPDNAA